jgi:hypothetical protein
MNIRTRIYLYNIPFKFKPPVQTAKYSKTMAQVRESMDDKAWNKYMGQVLHRSYSTGQELAPSIDHRQAKTQYYFTTS